MNRFCIIGMFIIGCYATDCNAQRRTKKVQRTTTHTVKRDYRDSRVLPAPPPNIPAQNVSVPQEKGRTVMQQQTSNSGETIMTPVPPPRKVVITPAPPPPGNTGTAIPEKR